MQPPPFDGRPPDRLRARQADGRPPEPSSDAAREALARLRMRRGNDGHRGATAPPPAHDAPALRRLQRILWTLAIIAGLLYLEWTVARLANAGAPAAVIVMPIYQ